jgi:tetratricopeptide (TPR) repeat protein/TolB-like protein
VYAGAAWVVLQLIDVLDGIVPLPDWVGPGALILLAIGLVVVLATAFVQGAADSKARAEAEEVPGAWELDLDRIDDEIRTRGLPHLTWARAALGGVVAFSLLFGIAGLVAFLKYRNAVPEPVPGLVAAEAPEPGLAVLPFDVRVADPELEVWDEGLVVTVAANLDGVEGLRTIDYGTVLARWAEVVPEGQVPDLATSLEAARLAGGEWAVRGSLLEIGDDIRIDATVRSVSSGETLEQIRVEGPADSIVPLIDRLSVEVLRAVLPEHGLEGGVGLESVASSSPQAVKAWVEGERDFRFGDFDLADESFMRAIEADSTFALAWLRLGQSRGWRRNTPGVGSGVETYERALAHADRLSPRERMLLRAQGALVGQDSIHPDSLRAFVLRHPDDAEAWAQLGERLYHALSADSMTASDAAFEQAIALQPQFVPYHIHAVDLAFQVFADSALARERVERLERFSPESPQARLGRIAYDLVYGTPEQSQAALDALPGLSLAEHLYLMPRLSHPAHSQEAEAVAYAAMARPDFPPAYQDPFRLGGSSALTREGRLKAALSLLESHDNPRIRYCGSAMRVLDAGVLPVDVYERFAGGSVVLGALEAYEGADAPSDRIGAVACVRELARFAGRDEDASAWTTTMDSMRAALPEDQRERAEYLTSIPDDVWNIVAALRDGDPRLAWELFEASPIAGSKGLEYEHLRARLLLALDRPEEALAALDKFGIDQLAEYERARAYEALGRDAEARASYEFFLEFWNPDLPELEARVDSATAGLTRIATRLN